MSDKSTYLLGTFWLIICLSFFQLLRIFKRRKTHCDITPCFCLRFHHTVKSSKNYTDKIQAFKLYQNLSKNNIRIRIPVST